MKRLAAFALLLSALPAAAQTAVRVRDAQGNLVCELTIPAGGVYEIVHPGPGPTPPAPVPPVPPNPPAPLPPNPPLPPPTPAPVAGTAAHVVIVRDDTPGVMSAGQVAALRDEALRAEVARRRLAWHVYDVSQKEVQSKPPAGHGYAKWLAGGPAAQPGVRTTALFLLDKDGKLVTPGVPLPADAAGILAAVKAATGG